MPTGEDNKRLQARSERLLITQVKKGAFVLVLAFVGWGVCAAIIGIGMSVWSQMNALVVHVIGAPIVFALISLFYFRGSGIRRRYRQL
jgi:hypothetical protein